MSEADSRLVQAALFVNERRPDNRPLRDNRAVEWTELLDEIGVFLFPKAVGLRNLDRNGDSSLRTSHERQRGVGGESFILNRNLAWKGCNDAK
jgi:hypothetical protein